MNAGIISLSTAQVNRS